MGSDCSVVAPNGGAAWGSAVAVLLRGVYRGLAYQDWDGAGYTVTKRKGLGTAVVRCMGLVRWIGLVKCGLVITYFMVTSYRER